MFQLRLPLSFAFGSFFTSVRAIVVARNFFRELRGGSTSASRVEDMALQAVQALERHLQSVAGNPKTLDRTRLVSALAQQLKQLEILPVEKNEVEGHLAAGSCPFTAEEKEELVVSVSAAADGSKPVGGSKRRSSQDYTRFARFLTLQHWNDIRARVYHRDKVEALLEILHMKLHMCLPTEPTLAIVTALTNGLERPDSTGWQLNSSYQTVKNTWKSMLKRFGKLGTASRKDLLDVLPARFDELPPAIMNEYAASRPAGVFQRPVPEHEIYSAASKINMRGGDKTAEKSLQALQTLARLVPAPSSVSLQEEDPLPNLQIFRRASSGPPTAGSHAALGSPQLLALPPAAPASSVGTATGLELTGPGSDFSRKRRRPFPCHISFRVPSCEEQHQLHQKVPMGGQQLQAHDRTIGHQQDLSHHRHGVYHKDHSLRHRLHDDFCLAPNGS